MTLLSTLRVGTAQGGGAAQRRVGGRGGGEEEGGEGGAVGGSAAHGVGGIGGWGEEGGGEGGVAEGGGGDETPPCSNQPHMPGGRSTEGELGRHSPLTLLKEDEKEAQRMEKEGMMEEKMMVEAA